MKTNKNIKKSIFNNRRKKTFREKIKEYDKNHKVPNWISAIVIITTIILTIKFVTWIITKNG